MIDLIQASDLRILLQDILVLALVMIALFGGSWPERIAIGTWLLCFEISSFVQSDLLGFEVNVTGFDAFLFVREIIACAAWVVLALYANRNYTLWIAGAQLLAIAALVARALIESISPIGYLFMLTAPGWIQLLAMAIGFTRHILRKRKYGAYRDWRITRKTLDFGSIGNGDRMLAGSGLAKKEPDL